MNIILFSHPFARFKKSASPFVIVLVLLLVACAGEQSDPVRISDTPKYQIAQEFEAFYEQFGGDRIFGEAISVPFDEGGEPLLQYFYAVRLEYDDTPENPDASRITVHPLGEWGLSKPNDLQPLTVPEDASSRYFPETGFTVQGDFLAFYESNNGELIFGPPISPELDREGMRVQYFRNVSLEFHPLLPEDQQIQLGPLGQDHFYGVMQFVYREETTKVFLPSNSMTSANVYASVQYPTLFAGDEQLLYITIQAPEGQSVSDLGEASLTITYGETSMTTDTVLEDDQYQHLIRVDTSKTEPGQQVELLISIFSDNGNLLGEDKVTFETWW